jgi:hypothetical protein
VENWPGAAIGGSLIGGTNSSSGMILSGGDMGVVKIGGDITGGTINAGSLDKSGLIESAGRIVSVTIGGSVIAGTDNSFNGGLSKNASIRAANDIGVITVRGDLIGSVSGAAITDVVLSARGQDAMSPRLTATRDLAFGKVSIGGRVERAQILAGYDTNLGAQNGNAQIGSVNVGGDWSASDLVAGAQDGGTAGFGDADDMIIGGVPESIAKIAAIVIKGIVIGTPAGGDQFGFESHLIGKFIANGGSISILNSVLLSPNTGNDVTIRLV